METRIIKIMTALGVPGVALGIFYLLLKQFGFSFSVIGPFESALIAVLFLVIVGGITAFAIHKWAPQENRVSIPKKRMPKPLSKPIETDLLGNDEINLQNVDSVLEKMFQGRKRPAPPPPDGPNHVLTFLQEPISTGERLLAESVEEAWVMAYIEKHMGTFTYMGRPIYTYGDRNGKRDAVSMFVKQRGFRELLDEISPRA